MTTTIPDTCQYNPDPCTAPSEVILTYEHNGGTRRCVVCKKHARYVASVAEILATEEIRR